MPRLSIVIPFRHDEERLESTLLSVLERRPEESEVIVVHDGSYADPFSLGDEVLFVEVDSNSEAVELINSGVMAACAPIVHVLADGVSVGPNWCENPLEMLERDAELAAVATAIQGPAGEPTFGISRRSIRRPSVTNIERAHCTRNSDEVSPRLECGFFRRKVLLALGGFNTRLGLMGAAIDFAWAMDALDLEADCDHHDCADASDLDHRLQGDELETLSNLAVAYGLADSGIGAATGALVQGLLSGQFRLAMPWVKGILAKPKHSLAVRLSNAKKQLEPELDVRPFPSSYEEPKRKAA